MVIIFTLYCLIVKSIEIYHASIDTGNLSVILQDSAGVLHLKKLSDAGLTHVHLLPCFQFGGVDDDRSTWKQLSNYRTHKIYFVTMLIEP